MKDRVGTLVLENGARRYANYDENGVLQGYMYLLLDDEPSEVGTVLNKDSLLSDDTAAALGLSGDPTVDDAFAKLVHTTSISVPSSGWSNSAPYTNTVTVSGVTAAMNIEYALNPTGTSEAIAEAFSFISSMETVSGGVKFRCNTDKPTVNIPIVLKGV